MSGVSLRPALYSGSRSSRNVRPGRVEHDRDVVGLLVGEHLRQHRREAVDRVRDRAVRRGAGRWAARRTPGTRASARRAAAASGARRHARIVRPGYDLSGPPVRARYAGLRRSERPDIRARARRRRLAARSRRSSTRFAHRLLSGGTATRSCSVRPCSSMSRPFARSMILRASSRACEVTDLLLERRRARRSARARSRSPG